MPVHRTYFSMNRVIALGLLKVRIRVDMFRVYAA
jgi:hypothetical protein